MNRGAFIFLMTGGLCLFPLDAPAASGSKIQIVTTTSTLASIAHEIAGGEAEIYFIAPPKRDLHHFVPTPKDVLKTRKADVFVHTGLSAEPWLAPLLDAAGRSEFMKQGGAAIDASEGISVLEIPASLSRLGGDIHPGGNPHYWLDPLNGKIVAANIAQRLGALYPAKAGLFRERSNAFQNKIDERMKEWTQRMEPFRGAAAVTYHRSWSYFAERFGLKILGELEPKPGIPPTGKHLVEIANLMKENGVKLIIKETYQESRTSGKVARETGAEAAELAQSVGANREAVDFFALTDFNVTQMERALTKGEA